MGNDEKVKFLKGTNVFKEVSIESSNPVCEHFLLRELSEGEKLYIKDEASANMSFIISGELEVKDGERLISVLAENNVVGEMGMFSSQTRSADVIAKSECKVLKIAKDDFFNFMFSDKDRGIQILQNIIVILSDRLRAKNIRFD